MLLKRWQGNQNRLCAQRQREEEEMAGPWLTHQCEENWHLSQQWGDGNKLTHSAEPGKTHERSYGVPGRIKMGKTLKQNEMKVYFSQLDPFPRTPGNSPTVHHSSRLGRSALAALWIRAQQSQLRYCPETVGSFLNLSRASTIHPNSATL